MSSPLVDRLRKRVTKRRKAVSSKRRHIAAEQRELDESAKRLAAARRSLERHSKPVASAADRAVDKACSFAGTTEQPAGSNRGRFISAWQFVFTPNYDGYAWCGAFLGAVLREVGVTGLTDRVLYTPFILEDARLGRNGFEQIVPATQAKKGDLVLFNFPGGAGVDHVGMMVRDYVPGGLWETIEGNTSSSNAGSQANGGGVFRRSRPGAVIAGVARPRWPK